MHVYVLLCMRCSCFSNKFMKSQALLPRAQPNYHPAPRSSYAPRSNTQQNQSLFKGAFKKKKKKL